ncbi:MAG: UDP binding domain-containing protein, partial [Thermoanaerobaculia bacterium]
GLLDAGASVRAFDPAAMEAFREDWPQIEYCDNSYDAAAGADGIVIATEWNQFKALELRRLKELLKRPLIVDLRNIYEPAKIRAAGFDYLSVGRVEAQREQRQEA